MEPTHVLTIDNKPTKAETTSNLIETQCRQKFNTIYANIQGLLTQNSDHKLKYLEVLLSNEDIDLLSLTETHHQQCAKGCKNCIADKEISIKNYNVMRTDRMKRRGGGCSLYLKDCYASEILTSISNDTVELLMIYVNTLKLTVINMYRPPEQMKISL